jgi:hypothetical protein
MLRQFLYLSVLVVLAATAAAQSPVASDAFGYLKHRWEYDPDLGAEWILTKSSEPVELDLASLQSSNLQIRLEAMHMAIRSVANFEVKNRQQAFSTVVEQLQADLDAAADQFALLTEVSAAVELAGSREQAEQVWSIVAEQPSLRQAIELKLLEWESPLPLDDWRQRLSDRRAGFGELLTALSGLETLGDDADQQLLQSFIEDRTSPKPILLQASRSLGAVARKGLEPLAEKILETSDPWKYEAAANLLRNHTSQASATTLRAIVMEGDPYAKAIAYSGLVQCAPSLATSLASELIDADDDNLRLAAVSALSKADDVPNLSLQASRLADVNLKVRQAVRENLRRRAGEQDAKQVVDDAITHFLSGDAWQGIEQAILLSVELQQNSRADVITGLLEHPNPRVNIRAAWAMQHLDLEPRHLQIVFDRSLATTQKLVATSYVSLEEEIHASFLFEALGVHRYEAASEMLEKYVPKNQQLMKTATRTSAIYALGLIWAENEDQSFADELVSRMSDVNPIAPERITVRYVSAIALGRIGAADKLPDLEQISDEPPSVMGLARDWSIKQLGGEP